MATSLRDRIAHAWNIFRNDEENFASSYNIYENSNITYGSRPDRIRLMPGSEKSIVSSIYTRIAIDVSSVNIKHVKIDDNNNYEHVMKSKLNDCLTVEANIDQSARQFFMDVVLSMLDEGVVAIVPVETDESIFDTSSFKIESMRCGKIVGWGTRSVRVRLYDDRDGKFKEINVPKERTAIIENPFLSVMNEPNSTLKRLISKLNLLDAIDNQSGSSKLDLIIQLPYTIKSEARKEQATRRKTEIENQLINSKYGIAYVDATEKITQLNRSIDNNLLSQIEYLTNLLYSQLGVTESVFSGTADEKTMLNYNNRTIEPILSTIVEEMNRKFLTKTARAQGQRIKFFQDPFRLVPVSQIADIADKLTRNEILSSNEIRSIIGYEPSSDPSANELRNKNINQSIDDGSIQRDYDEYEEVYDY